MPQAFTLFSPEDSHKIAALARRVARQLGLSDEEVAGAGELARVHDVGRKTLPEGLLRKRTPLSPAELRLLHRHPQAGADLLAAIPKLSHLAPLVRSSHERWDGRGYPDGLRGEEIPLACRIVYACEAFVALLSDRPYRAALDAEVVQEVFRLGSGRQFCPTVTAALLRVIAPELVHAPQAVEPAGAVEPLRSQPSAANRRSAARAARRNPRRTATLVYALGALVGVAITLVVALPVESVADRCPPAGEGLVQCQAQKIGMKLSLLLLLTILGTTSLAHFLAFTLPSLHARWRAGELTIEDRPFPEGDQTLVAAHWGFVPGRRSRVLRKHRFDRVA